jgi:phage tail-like protein
MTDSDDKSYALPVAFYFMVEFSDSTGKWEIPFQEVSGIKSTIETEDVKEGGENRFVHKLPKPVKFSNLVLKSAVQKQDSPLVKWCVKILESDFSQPFVTKDINIMLLNKEGTAIMHWHFSNAYPVSWEIDTLNSTKNDVAIETIELCYSYSKREDA